MSTQLDCSGLDHTIYNNCLYPGAPFYKAKGLPWLQENYEPTDNEIYVVTYPKTGTTLTQQICHQIMECYYHKTKSQDAAYYGQEEGHHSHAAWIDLLRDRGQEGFHKYIAATKNTMRFWKTHTVLEELPFKGLPKKMIICCRNPKDALVSFYHHYKNKKRAPYTGTFDTFFTLYIAGLVESNSYFDYYRKYWQVFKRNMEKKETEIYWLNYEDLVESEQSKRNEIRKLIKFIGVDDVVHSEQDLHRIMNRTSMRKMQDQYRDFGISNFVRKGAIGDWKNYLSEEQNEIMDALIKLHFHGTDFKYYRDLQEEKRYLLRSKL